MTGVPVVCRSTPNSTGCGHPTTDHDGDKRRACGCCSWANNNWPIPLGNRAARRAMEKLRRRAR